MGNKKLLITTQILDIQDPILGFFHEWVKKLALHYESVTVICLKKGEYNLPKNVKVLSLGKKEGQSRVKYVYRFFKYIFQLGRYDSVFVHMNEEYVLLGGWLWRLFGKKVSLWRNHKQGTWRTRVAVFFAHTVFFTSPDSYTARFKKAVQMPVGIDTDRFYSDGTEKALNSIVYIGRISPVKKIECLIEATACLLKKGVMVSVDLFGPEIDSVYSSAIRAQIQHLSLEKVVSFKGVAKPEELRSIYNRYTVCVNMTPSGSFDKTIFESVLCGAFPVISNTSINIPDSARSVVLFKAGNPDSMSEVLFKAFSLDQDKKNNIINTIATTVKEEHGIDVLVKKLLCFV